MSEPTRERIIVSVGGSLIVPDQIDTSFLTRFRDLVQEKIGQGFSFYIITGGGKTARNYQDAARAIGSPSSTDLDWIGINATRINAQLMRSFFGRDASDAVIQDVTAPLETEALVLVAGGYKPGNSSDLAAVQAARATGAKRLINLSNIDYVYTADPRKNPDAQKIEKISWTDFRKLIPDEWNPGLSSPFDPIAAKEAQTLGLEVAVMNGAHLDEFSNYLENKAFIGTVIS